jgi:hypothetical protein
VSDFLFSSRRLPPRTLATHLEHFLGPIVTETTEYHGSWGSLAVARAPFDVRPVVECDGRITALIGDPVYHGDDHSALIDDATRLALHRELSYADLARTAARLDGHFAALTIDAATGHGALLTDRFCFVGAFHTTHLHGGGLVLGSHVDAVARAAGRGGDVDLVSAADFALHATSTFPWTLYEGVAQMLPGAIRTFCGRGWTEPPRVYWAPAEEAAFATVAEAGRALRAAMCADARAATAHTTNVDILLSGGEDSRAVLGAIPPDKRIRAVIYADWESREVRAARRAARALGAELDVALRGPGHYLDAFEIVAAAVGSVHVFTGVHGFGFHRTHGLGDSAVVLGGLSSDSLLKNIFRKHRAARIRDDAAIRSDLRAQILDRRMAFRDELARLRPSSADEWMLLWPFSMRTHGGNVDGNRRLFRNHEVYHATAVLDVAARSPAEWKRDRRLFCAATRPLLRRTWYVPHGKHRFPYFGRTANVLLRPPLMLARVARALVTGELRSRHDPWPEWRELAESEAMVRAERAYPVAESPLASLFEPSSAADLRRAMQSWNPFRRFMLLQLAFVSGRARS